MSREIGDGIAIGNNIEVKVLRIAGTRVQLGINAPAEVPIFRKEVLEAARQTNLAEASAKSENLANVPSAPRVVRTTKVRRNKATQMTV